MNFTFLFYDIALNYTHFVIQAEFNATDTQGSPSTNSQFDSSDEEGELDLSPFTINWYGFKLPCFYLYILLVY